MRPREARLKEAYADWYPSISTGVWHHAGWVAEKVLRQQRVGSPSWQLEGRPLSDAHFDFQGGQAPPPRTQLRHHARLVPR